MLDYYKILNLNREASFTSINDAYEKLKRVYTGDKVSLQQLEEAWSTLANPITRNEYDRALAQRPNVSSVTDSSTSSSLKQSSNHRITELIDSSPSPSATQTSRPRTEVIDTRPPPPSSPSTSRPGTEIIDYQMTAPHERPGSRSQTEIIDNVSKAGSPPTGASSTPNGPIRILVTENDNPVAEYKLNSGTHVIGRSPKNGEKPSVQLNNRFVSRRHAVIEITPGSVSIMDDGSLNGTRLDGERLDTHKPYKLYDRAIIQIETFVLVVDFGNSRRSSEK